MSRPDNAPAGPLKRMDGEPVFDEPWQAQILAIADSLVANGAFTPADWSNALGEELRRADGDTAPHDVAAYYNAVQRAVERLVANTGAISSQALTARRDAWSRAYLETPHGQPVELKPE